MMRPVLTATALSLLVLPACGGRYSPRVVEIDGDGAGGDIDITYGAGGYIDEIDIGSRDIELEWEGGLVVGFDDDGVEGVVEYEGGNLSKVVREDNDGDDTTLEYTWEGGRLVSINTETEIGSLSFDGEINFRYDDAGRVDEVTYITETAFGDIEVEHKYRYDDSGRLDEVDIGNSDYEFRYNDDGTLDEVDVGNNEYQLSYDDGGRISQVEVGNNDYDISYDDGGLAPLNLEPVVIIKAGYIDWAGKTYSSPASDSLLLTLGEVGSTYF